MIRNLTIERFKSLMKLEIELGRINVFVGANGSGKSNLLGAVGALALHPRAPKCLAIDNVDQALDPRLARKLTEALCSWTSRLNGGRQWLMTANNPAVLDGLPLRHTVVKRIDLETARKARPSDEWRLSRMWMNGLLGGVPNV